MPEPSPENRSDEQQIEESREIDPKNLSFKELQEAYKLAHTTFTEVDDGFVSVDGSKISLRQVGEKFKINGFPDSRNNQELHRLILSEHYNILRNGSPDKEVMINTIRKLLEEAGKRIIE